MYRVTDMPADGERSEPVGGTTCPKCGDVQAMAVTADGRVLVVCEECRIGSELGFPNLDVRFVTIAILTAVEFDVCVGCARPLESGMPGQMCGACESAADAAPSPGAWLRERLRS